MFCLVILPGVILAGCPLHVNLNVFGNKAFPRLLLVLVNYFNRFFIPLERWQTSHDGHYRELIEHERVNHVPVSVEDLITGKEEYLQVNIVHVGDIIIEHLRLIQGGVIHPDGV